MGNYKVKNLNKYKIGMQIGLALVLGHGVAASAHATSMRPAVIVSQYPGEIEVAYLLGAEPTFKLMGGRNGEITEIKGPNVACTAQMIKAGPMLPAFHWDHTCRFVITRDGEMLAGGHDTREAPIATAIGMMNVDEFGEEVGLTLEGRGAELLRKFLVTKKIKLSGMACNDQLQSDAACTFGFDASGRLIEERESILDDLRGRKTANLKSTVYASVDSTFEDVDAKRSRLKVDFDHKQMELKLQPRGDKAYIFGGRPLQLVAAYEQACGVRVYVARLDQRPSDGSLSEIVAIDRSRFYEYCQSLIAVIPLTVKAHVMTSGMGGNAERFMGQFDANGLRQF